MDYGLDMLAGYVIAVDDHNKAYVIKELYRSGLIIPEAAKKVKELCEGEDIYAYFAPPDMWNKRQETGKSMAEIFYEHGITLAKANNNRVHGWMDMKSWLHPLRVESRFTR
jgi:phage terminase large subunit